MLSGIMAYHYTMKESLYNAFQNCARLLNNVCLRRIEHAAIGSQGGATHPFHCSGGPLHPSSSLPFTSCLANFTRKTKAFHASEKSVCIKLHDSADADEDEICTVIHQMEDALSERSAVSCAQGQLKQMRMYC